MKFSAYSLLSVALVVVLVPFLNGQHPAASSAPATTAAVSHSDAPDACPHAFTVGSGNSSIL